MGKQIPISKTFTVAGKEYTLETGKLASLADGAVLLRQGNTMILATVCGDKAPRPGQSFFPLSVDYREKFAGAGRIPGNFFRREARISDYEVLISRLIDRAVRPLFPDHYMCDTKVDVTLLGCDSDAMPDALACLAASAAFTVSDIPFGGPISEVRVARINGEFVINPSRTEVKDADIDIIVAATMKDILMVEGEADECSEIDMVEAIKFGHIAIKEMCQAQLELREMVGVTGFREVAEHPSNDELKAFIWETGKSEVYNIAKSALPKQERRSLIAEVEEKCNAAVLEKHGEEFVTENKGLMAEYFHDLEKETVRDLILSEGIRLDGRKTTEIRPIWCEIDYIPTTHGSAVFTRGETQSLTTVTLGTKLDEQMIDIAQELSFDKFMLHYNFPSFSTGETKPNRAPSRREIGHGNLARRSVQKMLPDQVDYTIRIVSDILESNGSSSMATVCAASLALMDSGIKMKRPVAGIAMGAITDDKGRVAILSDILGDEDHLGDMDFKVTGTEKGICGCQMDIKIDGMPYELLVTALEQARAGRLHILGVMGQTIAEPKEDLKPHAPRIITMEVESEYIGAIIGSGGKVIQGMQKETGTVINIEEVGTKGIVTIASPNLERIERARKMILGIITEPEVGQEFEGKIVKITTFGVFVEYAPGKEGLVHISELSYSRLNTVEDGGFEVDQVIPVQYMGVDERNGKHRFSHRALLEKPEGYVERVREERPRDDRRDDRRGGGGYGNRNDRGGRDDRRGGGDDRNRR